MARWKNKPLGCPVFVLDSGNKQHKLFAIYLGLSPNYTRLVHLISSMRNGHVSPQFHMCFDDMFETIREIINIMPSQWQMKTSLVTNNLAAEPDFQHNRLANNNQSGYQGEGLE